MGRCRHWMDGTALEFPRAGFWLVHIVGAFALFFLGMRFAVRRAPMSLIAYRVLKLLSAR